MYGLDLFSGIGGITKALDGYVTPVAYCENDRYAQAVLLSRMSGGHIPVAPIWDEVRTLRGVDLPRIEIIYGGFPCQDLSVAGRGAGLAGKRSGLFFEIARLVSEIRPRFIFLENVPAIHLRGGDTVVGTLADLGYDCRWDVLSAADVGANHLRGRWWLLAYSNRSNVGRNNVNRDVSQASEKIEGKAQGKDGEWLRSRFGDGGEDVANAKSKQDRRIQSRRFQPDAGASGPMANTRQELRGTRRDYQNGESSQRSDSTNKLKRSSTKVPDTSIQPVPGTTQRGAERQEQNTSGAGWWKFEPNVGRVAHGIPQRVDRLRGLGNSVVPAQAREAFERLMGLK